MAAINTAPTSLRSLLDYYRKFTVRSEAEAALDTAGWDEKQNDQPTVVFDTNEFDLPQKVPADGIDRPQGFVWTAKGILITDGKDNRVQLLSHDGKVSNFAGVASADKKFQNGPAASAVFNGPAGIAYDQRSKVVYICDSGNHAIRSIDPKGNVFTLAGGGTKGLIDGASDAAKFDLPTNCAIHWQDDVLLVADTANHAIRAVILADGRVRTIAGTGAPGHNNGRGREAVFHSPTGIAVSRSCEFVYVSDTGNNCIRRINREGVVHTIAGGPNAAHRDGTGADARFSSPAGLIMDHDDNLLVADPGNGAIRKLVYDGFSGTYTVSTIIGPFKGGRVVGESEVAAAGVSATFAPTAITYNPRGTVFYLEGGTNPYVGRVRRTYPILTDDEFKSIQAKCQTRLEAKVQWLAHITIHKAKIIEGLNLDVGGKADPFATVKFNGAEIGRTGVAPKTLEPEWNYAVPPLNFDMVGDPPMEVSAPRCQIVLEDKDFLLNDLVGNGSFALVNCEDLPVEIARDTGKALATVTVSVKLVRAGGSGGAATVEEHKAAAASPAKSA